MKGPLVTWFPCLLGEWKESWELSSGWYWWCGLLEEVGLFLSLAALSNNLGRPWKSPEPSQPRPVTSPSLGWSQAAIVFMAPQLGLQTAGQIAQPLASVSGAGRSQWEPWPQAQLGSHLCPAACWQALSPWATDSAALSLGFLPFRWRKMPPHGGFLQLIYDQLSQLDWNCLCLPEAAPDSAANVLKNSPALGREGKWVPLNCI